MAKTSAELWRELKADPERHAAWNAHRRAYLRRHWREDPEWRQRMIDYGMEWRRKTGYWRKQI